ncbi:CsgG/HfaB family protein [Undibacterium sp. Ren11W]|uniref:CsgG/HfaB family protein n=1 Tax=Undibacterium sp. Ren11W TaxID=3413045 RepID=UPI003BF127E2
MKQPLPLVPSGKLALLSAALLLCSAPVVANAAEMGTIEKCNRNFGTLAIAEPQSEILTYLGRYKLGSPSTMLRMIAQESGCFTIVERGVAMQNLQQERALAAAGQMQDGSNVGGGQLQAADFVMTPAIQFSEDTGGLNGAIGGLFGHLPGALGALGGLAGGLKFKEAETTLLLADVRSGIQVASAEGQASKMNFSLDGWGWGGMGWASAGGYSKTPEGKLIAASLLDNFNKIALAIRDKPQLIQATSASSKRNAAGSIRASNPREATAASSNYSAPPSSNNAGAASGLGGMYAVKFTGDDNGTVNVMVNNSGAMTGMGVSSKYKTNFTVSGTISQIGEFILTGAGKAGAAQFMGSIDAQSGAVMGMWQWGGNSPAQGTFSGQKQ